MAIVIVDGNEIEIGDHERLNGIEVAQRAGVDVPHYCWHAGLTVVASCRMCLVETGSRNPDTNQISMVPKLVPACQTPAKDGTVFVTNSDKVKHARAMVEEDLLIEHPIDCPICDKAGECHLQDYHFEHGQAARRADIRPFTSRRRPMGETVTLFVDRCVMCSRCVRFCREITGTNELMVIHRGADEEIDVFPGYPLANKLAGNVVDLCPVGALGDKDFLYRQRVWFMKAHDGVCAGCSTGCSILVEENQDHVYRLKPRENPEVNQWWMCDEGRYGYHHVHSDKRLVELRRRDHASDNGEFAPIEWSPLVKQLNEGFSAGAGRLAAAVSPHLTVEEAWLLCQWIRQRDSEALLVLGPVPVEGEDERFPTGFTIRAEKCPNRRGVEEVLSHFAGRVAPFEELLTAAETGNIDAAWISGGYTSDWIDQASAQRLRGAKTLVVQDLFASPVWDVADYQLPGAAFAEREGSYVNHADRLQSFAWAIRPPSGVQTEGRLYWQLSGKAGLYSARRVLDEVARQIGYFALATEPIPPIGIDLKLNRLAGEGTEAKSQPVA